MNAKAVIMGGGLIFIVLLLVVAVMGGNSLPPLGEAIGGLVQTSPHSNAPVAIAAAETLLPPGTGVVAEIKTATAMGNLLIKQEDCGPDGPQNGLRFWPNLHVGNTSVGPSFCEENSVAGFIAGMQKIMERYAGQEGWKQVFQRIAAEIFSQIFKASPGMPVFEIINELSRLIGSAR